MTKTFIIEDGQMPSKEQLVKVSSAAERVIWVDDNSPELSPAMYKAFKCVMAHRNRDKCQNSSIFCQ